MSDLILCAKASTAKQPNSDRFSGTRFLLISTTVLASFQGFLPGLTLPFFKGQK